jgi:DNA-binding beta-propeller fold protein YncE
LSPGFLESLGAYSTSSTDFGNDPKKLTREQIMQIYLPFAVDKVFSPLLHSIGCVITLAVCAGLLGYLAFYVGPPFLPPGGPIIVAPTAPAVPYTRHQKYVYVAVAESPDHAGGIAVFDDRAFEVKGRFITLSSRFNRAVPTCVAVAPGKRKLFVTDNAAGRLYVIDEMWDLHAVAVGLTPVCVAVSPDERKAYVTNEQPAPYGTISVVDIDKEVVSDTISGVNCPKQLAVSRDGKRIYVTTECGGGHDPLLVVETDTDRVIATIPDVEIGRAPAVSPDGKRFVRRASQPKPISY